jgi:hypothetical protein
MGELSAAFQVQALRPARPTRVRARSCSGAAAELQIGVGGLLLAELFYYAAGGDGGRQWVKLSNASSVPIDLSQYSLGAGTSSYRELTAPLDGELLPGACFIVGGPESSGHNGWPHYSQVIQFAPTIPHAGADSAAGVALFDVATANTGTLPLDAVVYGARNQSGLVRPDGSVALPDAAETRANRSLVRTSSGWRESMLPTPNTCIQ